MADISKIKTPDGTTYDLKDTTARANSGVTGVKGNSESTYRKGNVNLTPANIGAVAKSDELQTTNPFTTPSLKGPYISKIDNAFYAADKRWTVTATNGGAVANLFDGSYETTFDVADGATSVVTMDFSPSTFPGYPYGYILVSVYYTARPASISCRAYCNYEPHGLGWFDIPLTMFSDSTSASTVYRGRQWRYAISKIEFTITGQKTGSYNTEINQIEMHLDRPDSSKNPFVSKYGAETLYYPLTAPIFIGSVTGDVSGTASNVTGTVAVANGGTGKTTANDAADNLISGLPAWTANPTDDTYFVRQDIGGASTFGRVKFSTLWNYIKGKFSGTSPITFSNGAIGINTASTSGYGATKLSTATNSTSTTEAATPSAVKTAYDLANTANGTANTALSGVNGTLIYDHTYSISNGVATFTAHVYQKGVEVTNNYDDSCFEWSYKLASAVTGTPSVVSLGTGKTKTITISTLGYGGYVLGTFTPPSA